MKKPETRFKEKVIAELKKLPVWFLKTQEMARHGTPDLLICAGGKFVAWELKVDADIEPLQAYNLERIRNADGSAHVVTPENFEECLNNLKEFIA